MNILKVLTDQRLRFIVIAAMGTITLIGIMGYMLFKNKYYYWIAYSFGIMTVALTMAIVASRVLKPYQIQRLIIFIDPESDPLGAGILSNQKLPLVPAISLDRASYREYKATCDFCPSKALTSSLVFYLKSGALWGGA